MTKQKSLCVFLLLVFFTQACNLQAKADVTATPAAQKTALPTPTRIRATPTQISATATQPSLSATPAPKVTVSAVTGNIFIRRGPDMAYNTVGVLYKGTTVNAIMRDTLSKWVQIIIPKTEQTGWVSLMTEYSKVEGAVDALPQFKVTDWPIAGYVRNCTLHRMVLFPGAIVIEMVKSEPENLVWVNPGVYMVFDLDMPDPIQIDTIETREGLTVDIRYDGTGEKRKCP